MDDVKYQEIEVQLSSEDGNAFVLIGAVRRALRRAGVSQEEIQLFSEESMKGDYDNVLQTCMKWVNVT